MGKYLVTTWEKFQNLSRYPGSGQQSILSTKTLFFIKVFDQINSVINLEDSAPV